jgi:hypothetical protein
MEGLFMTEEGQKSDSFVGRAHQVPYQRPEIEQITRMQFPPGSPAMHGSSPAPDSPSQAPAPQE